MPEEVVKSHAERVATLVKQAAYLLHSNLHARAQRAVVKVVGQHSPLEGLRTTMVLWLNALLTQQRLHSQGVKGIPPLQGISGSRPMPSVQVKAWKRILEVNWRSIFEPAVRALGTCGDWQIQMTAEALIRLTEAVEVIENADLGQHINLGAELFPRLASDRKESAAFYTQPATAELLACLTIQRSDREKSQWADPGLLRQSVIADFACGTGTLLRAGYLRIQDLHAWAGATKESLSKLHRGAMESGLRGTDISPIAAHLTSSTLASIGHGESYGDTQVGWVKVGGALSRTGALEYVASEVAQDLFGRSHGKTTGVRDEKAAKSVVEAPHHSVDWILMNPPYSRTRGGQSAFDLAGLTEADRKRCQKRWKRLMKDEPVDLRAGMAASFLVIARHKAKRGTGRIGFVLPLTSAFAVTWAKTRAMVECEFTDILLIATASGASLRHAGFSADTGMEEMLLVATRRENGGKGSRSVLYCVTLYEPCTRNGEARELARAITVAKARCVAVGTTHPITVGDGEVGCITAMRPRGNGAPWNMVGVTHGAFALAADALTEGRIDHIVDSPIPLGVEMGTIGGIFRVGSTHHLLGHLQGSDPIGAFEFHRVRNETDAIGKDRAMWRADSKKQRSLRVLPTHKGLTPPGSDSAEMRDRQEKMRATASTLFYARNLRWTSQALLAATTAQPALGGRAWTALGHADVRVLKAAALWWNSTLGLVVHWTQGQRTQSGRSTTQIGALKNIPCPRLDTLANAALDLASERFDALADQVLLPAKDADKDPVRIQIDDAVIDILESHRSHSIILQGPMGSSASIGDETRISAPLVRKLLCTEPSIQGA